MKAVNPKLRNRALFMVRQAHHDGRHPELVEGKKQRWEI
jgi:hypothetical protein